MNVVIAEDLEMMRELLGSILVNRLGCVLLGSAREGREALEIVISTRPQLLILDLNMPGLSGLEVIASIRELKLHTKFLVFSAYCTPFTAYCLEKLGIDGFLSKARSDITEFRAAITAIAKDCRYFSTPFTALCDVGRRNSSSVLKQLSPRETEVYNRVAALLKDGEMLTALVTAAPSREWI